MKVNIIKSHHEFALGIQDIADGLANYLVNVGVAEPVEKDWLSKDQNEEDGKEIPTKEDVPVTEKKVVKGKKEKKEIKTKVPIQKK